MAELRQTTFAAGEWADALHGADHLAGYAAAARLIRNAVVSKLGTIVSRPGTIFCQEVKDSTKATRLLRFDFSDDQSYALEAGHLYARIYQSDGTRLAAEALIALGVNNATVARSTDKGATWTDPSDLPSGLGANGACQAAGGRLIVVAEGAGSTTKILYSDDRGTTWVEALSLGASNVFNGVASNGRTIVAVGVTGSTDALIYYSADNGTTWANAGAVASNWLRAVAWGNGRWVAVGTTSSAAAGYVYSYDGVHWSASQEIGDLAATWNRGELYAVAFLNGQFIAVGRAHTFPATTYARLWATIGVLDANWKWGILGTPSANSSDGLYGIASDGRDLAVAVGGATQVTVSTAAYGFRSSTGAWTNLSPAAGAAFRAVAYSRGYFVAVGSMTTGPASRCSRYDGVAWTSDPSLPDAGAAYEVIASCAGTEIHEVVTPYPTGLVRELATVQSGDVLTIFHRYFPPKEFVRFGLHDWRLRDWFKEPPTLTASNLAFDGAIDQTGDTTHPPLKRQWVVAWEDEETGRESKPSAALTPPTTGKVVCYPDKPVTIKWDVIVKAARYYVYAGSDGRFGFVGTVEQPTVPAGSSPTTASFEDKGFEPVFSDSPRQWRNPFQSDLAYPSCGCYFDDRLVTAGSLVQPGTVLGSAVADYYNHDENVVTKASDSLEFTLSARRYEEIRWLVPLERLIAGTSEGEWVIGGAGDEALAFDSINARARSQRGSQRVQPVVVGEGVLYVQAGGKTVRDFYFNSDAAEWGGTELSAQAQHLLDGYTIVDWAYAKEPRSIVWLVRSDGALLSCTFLREQQAWAWARHDTGGDAVEAVTTIPNGTEDVLFLVVRRTINGSTKRYVERLATSSPASSAAAIGLDCALVYSGASVNTIPGLSHLEGRTVGVWAGGTYRGTYTVSSGSVTFTGAAATYAVVGLVRTTQFRSMDWPEGRMRRKTVARVGLEYLEPSDLADTEASVKVGEELATASIRKVSGAENRTLWVPVNSGWNPGGRCAIEHTEPWTLEIRGITREVV